MCSLMYSLSLLINLKMDIKKIKATGIVMMFLHSFTNFQTLSPKTIAVFKSPSNTHTQSTINITMIIKRNVLTPTLDYRASYHHCSNFSCFFQSATDIVQSLPEI